MKKLIAILAGLFFLAFTGSAFAEYTDNEDGTITDSRTNLMWQQSDASYLNWDAANSYCTQSGTGGYGDWRFPTLTELQLLLDPAYTPMIDPIFITVNSPSWYWTSTVDGDFAWCVSFYYGSTRLREKSIPNYHYARCVRGATTPPPTSCISIGSDLYISIPCVEYMGVQYRLNLKYWDQTGSGIGSSWIIDSLEEK